ncbi:MAG: hypothetical protein A3E85_01075 [Gammaproteobacteria bacterium RIFCSPHIGHO2_12_FULL_45_12]|nr:MAG: hypothetical protein A3E85_01075 [Gammaproteobacteria bacterium RIFCSPHIGHO2_12_FULL_45_12]
MMSLILNSYLSIFVSIGVGALCLFSLGLYWISKSVSDKNALRLLNTTAIRAIAGDDVMATELDLARAYLEIDKKDAARLVLRKVAAKGTVAQRKEAKLLLGRF